MAQTKDGADKAENTCVGVGCFAIVVIAVIVTVVVLIGQCTGAPPPPKPTMTYEEAIQAITYTDAQIRMQNEYFEKCLTGRAIQEGQGLEDVPEVMQQLNDIEDRGAWALARDNAFGQCILWGYFPPEGIFAVR